MRALKLFEIALGICCSGGQSLMQEKRLDFHAVFVKKRRAVHLFSDGGD